MSKKVVVLGATGSIGTQTLDILSRYPEQFTVYGLSAHHNLALIEQQSNQHLPIHVVITGQLSRNPVLPQGTQYHYGKEALVSLVSDPCVDIVVIGLVGHSALEPVSAAIAAGKTILLANKECLVMAGELLLAQAKVTGAQLFPVDSEHNALWQVLRTPIGQPPAVSHLTITASGGPFVNYTREQLKTVTPAMALVHPNWKMGAKVTVDSATLMNKALELIEAQVWFNLPAGQLDAVIHPQSLVHGWSTYEDGSTLMHLSIPDMRIPISYALGYPKRLALDLPKITIADLQRCSFMEIDKERFPAIRIAFEIMQAGSLAHRVVLNASNAVAVDLLLAEKLPFNQIEAYVEKALQQDWPKVGSIAEALALDEEVRAVLTGCTVA